MTADPSAAGGLPLPPAPGATPEPPDRDAAVKIAAKHCARFYPQWGVAPPSFIVDAVVEGVNFAERAHGITGATPSPACDVQSAEPASEPDGADNTLGVSPGGAGLSAPALRASAAIPDAACHDLCDPDAMALSLFEHIAHGDSVHRAWLNEAAREWASGWCMDRARDRESPKAMETEGLHPQGQSPVPQGRAQRNPRDKEG